jgi:hypothetical protein
MITDLGVARLLGDDEHPKNECRSGMLRGTASQAPEHPEPESIVLGEEVHRFGHQLHCPFV